MNLFSWIKEKANYNAQISRFNVMSAGIIGAIGHPAYWLLWTYIFPEGYDSTIIRFTSSLLCIISLTNNYWSTRLKPYFSLYWFFMTAYILPFAFTAHLLVNQFSDIWIMCQVGMFFIIAIFIHNFVLMTINIVIGVLGAVIYCFIYFPEVLHFEFTYIKYIPIFFFAYVCGYIFNYSNSIGIALEERSKSLESLGGSIAHEMRNPLGSIQQSVHLLLDKLKQIPEVKKTNRLVVYRREVEEVSDLLKIINRSSVRGNMIIDMILSNIHGKDIDKSKFKIHKMSHIVNNAINEFAFVSRSEKGKVSINIERDFYFKGDENMFVFVIFNLLKNALYYLKTYPDSTITLSTKKEDKSDKEFNYFYFRDTGAGIASDKLESIFESFMTSGKAGGTGLGLPFCRRVVTAFGGKIICNSELGEYTEFVISLPKISDEDRKNKDLYVKEVEELDFKEAIKQKYSNKTILLVDDQLVNRRISASRLEKLGFNAIMAEHGKEALNILDKRGAEIDIIFMDLQMPEINGYETTKLIQLGQKNKAGHKFQNCQNHKNIIIIAFTGDDDEVTLQRIEDYNMRGRLGKSWSDQELFNVLNQIL